MRLSIRKKPVYHYQAEVRRMLVIDSLALKILTPEEKKQIKSLGLRFGPRPKESPDVFFVCSVYLQPPHNVKTSKEAMMEGEITMVFVTEEMIADLKRHHKDVVSDICQEIENMEAGWRSSHPLRYMAVR